MFSKLFPGWTGSVFGKTGTGPLPTDELSARERDALFIWQFESGDFERLTAESLMKAKITETHQYASSVLNACHKAGVIDAATGHPNTARIDRHLVSKIAIITVFKQRQLVNMLFFWEEELTRWRLLDEEQHEAKTALERDPENTQASEALRVVAAKRRVLPSDRDEQGKGREEALPSYTA